MPIYLISGLFITVLHYSGNANFDSLWSCVSKVKFKNRYQSHGSRYVCKSISKIYVDPCKT